MERWTVQTQIVLYGQIFTRQKWKRSLPFGKKLAYKFNAMYRDENFSRSSWRASSPERFSAPYIEMYEDPHDAMCFYVTRLRLRRLLRYYPSSSFCAIASKFRPTVYDGVFLPAGWEEKFLGSIAKRAYVSKKSPESVKWERGFMERRKGGDGRGRVRRMREENG